MRESKFVEQNKEKWAQFEKDIVSKKKDPYQLRAHLLEITDDLSYSRTFYKNRSVRVYLNGLGQQIYNNIYRNKKNFIQGIGGFFKDEVPRIMYFSRKELLVCFLVFLLSVAIGVFSSAKDAEFARSILGDSYVNMTLENIQKGDPLGVYKNEGQISMFFYIAINNLKVSLFIFLAGLLASYGALVIMARNGIMLGVFMYFFYSRNIVSEFNLTVWMHGTIEMLSMIIETVAGMLLGRGLIYPGTLSRAKAFSIWGKRGALVFLSAIPFIIFAAFIESFLTRYTEMPDLIRAALIILSLAVMVIYFVWYPYFRFAGTNDEALGDTDLKPETKIDFKTNIIYSNGQIFLKSIQLFGNNFSVYSRKIIAISVLYFGLIALFFTDSILKKFQLLEIDYADAIVQVLSTNLGKFIELYKNLGLIISSSGNLGMYFLSTLWFTSLLVIGMHTFHKNIPIINFSLRKTSIISFLFIAIPGLLLFTDIGLLHFIYIMLTPLIIVLCITVCFQLNSRNILNKFVQILGNGIGRMSGVLFLFLVSGFIGMLFVVSPFSYLAVWAMEMNIELSETTYKLVLQSIMIFAFIIVSSYAVLFYITQCIFLSYTIDEISEARGLIESIEQIGESKKTYGIETE